MRNGLAMRPKYPVGYMFQCETLVLPFIDNLRASAVVVAAGGVVLPDLRGNVDIPRVDTSATFQWLGDDDDVVDSDLVLSSVSLEAKTIAGAVPISRRLMKNSVPAIDDLVLKDLSRGAGLALDLAALEGDGLSNAPLGISNTVGVGTVTIAAAAGTGVPTWAEAVEFENVVDDADALAGSLAYIMHPGVRGGCKTSPKDAGSGLFVIEDNECNGYPTLASSQVPAKRIFFGDWTSVLLALWGAVDIQIDVATKAASGGIVVRTFLDCDVGIRHPQSFAINA